MRGASGVERARKDNEFVRRVFADALGEENLSLALREDYRDLVVQVLKAGIDAGALLLVTEKIKHRAVSHLPILAV